MLIELTGEPLMQLLVDATRREATSGPALAGAHRAVGRALAARVADRLPLEAVEIAHVAGPSSGVRIRPGAEPVVVALLRAGLFVAEGIWESLPGAALVVHGRGPLAPRALAGRTVVVVDGVINTGRTIRDVLAEIAPCAPAQLLVVTLVGYRPALERLAADLPGVDVVAARVSDRSYVGRGSTDTGARLFGTTHCD